MDKIPLDDLKQRTVIVGNSGAGKSTLAEKLAHIVSVPAIDLDRWHWEEEATVTNATRSLRSV
jgi:adenylate kinase family enzyme